ncbi:hypothetical protein IB289_22415 [Vibrio parahaemolyticus]|uniref:hypothetical protein n=1 Tax=Vibrio parahaemolyticus TaxID=670 RepID=UPI001D160CF7|nr:hypothetical protein [Vibrio parahaemolyticus]MCC3859115.1 hypothetical protein [Vibrio parahaemolyticus]
MKDIAMQFAVDLETLHLISTGQIPSTTNKKVPSTASGYVRHIMSTFSQVLPHLYDSDINALHSKGLMALSDSSIWIRYEIATLHFQEKSKGRTEAMFAMNKLTEFWDGNLVSPSLIQTSKKNISISFLYEHSLELFHEVKELYSKIPRDNNSLFHRVVSHSSIGLKELLDDPEIGSVLKDKGFDFIARDKALSRKARKEIITNRNYRVAINHLMKLTAPDIYDVNSFRDENNSHKERIAELKKTAKQLAFDLDVIHLSRKEKSSLQSNREITTGASVYVRQALQSFSQISKYLHNNDIQALNSKGLMAFSDISIWERYESATLNFQELNETGSATEAIFTMRKLTSFLSEDLTSPSIINTYISTVSIASLYTCGLVFFREIKGLYDALPKGNNSAFYRVVSSSITAFKLLFDDESILSAFKEKGFNYVANDKELSRRVKELLIRENHRHAIGSLLKLSAPDVHGLLIFRREDEKQYEVIFGHNIDVSLLKKISERLASHIVEYARAKSITSIAELYQLIGIGKLLESDVENLSIQNLGLLREKGAEAFIENDAELLMWAEEVSEGTTIAGKTARASFLFLQKVVGHVVGYSIDVRDYQVWQIPFPLEGRASGFSYMSIRSIYDLSPKLASELRCNTLNMFNSRLGDSLSSKSAESFAYSFKIGLSRSTSKLTEKQRELIWEKGISAFSANRHQILKLTLKEIQAGYKNKKYSDSTARYENRAIKKLMELCSVPVIDVYPIHTGKRAKHVKRDVSKSEYYENNEIVELAFYIEQELSKTNNYYHELGLRIARIFIKTGWNPTPVTELEVDDFMKMTSTLQGVETHFVRLFKRRASYKTEWDKFSIDANDIDWDSLESGGSVRNALVDLLYIRDVMSKPLREALPKGHLFKNSIMIYADRNGEVCRITHSKLHKLINKLLNTSIVFSTQRIRNSGMNYMYQAVQKDFKKYNKVAGHHTFEVFMRNYFRFDVDKSQQKLSDALKVMAEYFSSRPITGDIKIVTEITNDMLRVPNGFCTSDGKDEETIAYLKEHKKLHKKSGRKSPKCAEFNACLWCEKFRAVAVAEQVWKLLSYRDFVIADMQVSVSDYENSTHQQEYIDLLTLRIDQIIKELDDLNKGVANEGAMLLRDNGVHPDWSPYIIALGMKN